MYEKIVFIQQKISYHSRDDGDAEHLQSRSVGEGAKSILQRFKNSGRFYDGAVNRAMSGSA